MKRLILIPVMAIALFAEETKKPVPEPAVTDIERLDATRAYATWLELKVKTADAETRSPEIMQLKMQTGDAETKFRTLITAIVQKCGGVEKTNPDYSCKVEAPAPAPAAPKPVGGVPGK